MLNRFRKIKIVLQLISSTTVLFVTAVEFGFIQEPRYKHLVFGLLALSVLGNSILSLVRISEERKKEVQDVFNKILDVASLSLAPRYAYDFRACILMPQNNFLNRLHLQSPMLEIKFFSSDMANAPDRYIKLDKHQGVSGQAWGSGEILVGDLTIPDTGDGPRWNLSKEQRELTKHLKAILAVPILSPASDVIGVLCFDSEMECADYFSEDDVKDIATRIADAIWALLISYNVIKSSEV
jgi:hypothetical protein